MKKNKFLLLLTLFISFSLSGQVTPIQIKCFGGSLNDYIYHFHPLNNGEYIFAGSSSSSDGDLLSNNGHSDCWFVHLDSNLNINHNISFGESGYDIIKDVSILSDTSYALLIQSNSSSGIFSGGFGAADAFIRTYYPPSWLSPAFAFGGSSDDMPTSIYKKSNGGYLVCGSSRSSDGHLPGNFGLTDFWVLSLTDNFSVAWSKNYGGSNYDEAIKIFQLSDGNIMVFGNTNSNNEMVHGNAGIKDVWVIKLNSMGDTIWTKTYGGTGYDEITNVKQIDTDRFALIGNSYSNNGDFFYMKSSSQEKISYNYGFYHIIDENGQFVFGGNMLLQDNHVFFQDMIYTSQQNLDILGRTDVDPDPNTSNDDILIVNFNNGLVIKTDTFGGNDIDGYPLLFGHKLNETDYLIATTTYSNDLTPTYHGSYDVLLAVLRRTQPSGIEITEKSHIQVYPNPAKITINIENLPHDNKWFYNLYDISGKILLNSYLSKERSIDISNIPSGIYIISLTDGKTSFAKRLVIEK